MRPQRLPTFSVSFLVVATVAAVASEARADVDPPRITHTPVEELVRGAPLAISATMTDESEIFAPTLYFRSPGEEGYDSVILQRNGDVYSAQLPATGDVQYWLEAYDEYGNGPSRSGAPGSPHLVVVVDHAKEPAVVAVREPAALSPPAISSAPPASPDLNLEPMLAPPEEPFLLPVEPRPVYRQWWFITGAGVVSAAAVGVLVYALRPDDVHRNTFGASVARP